MSQYDRGFYEATAARNFQDAMDAAADASLALVNRQHASNSVSMADYNSLKNRAIHLQKCFDEVVAQRDESDEAIKVHRAVLTRYIREEKILDAAKLNADLRNMAAQMNIPWP